MRKKPKLMAIVIEQVDGTGRRKELLRMSVKQIKQSISYGVIDGRFFSMAREGAVGGYWMMRAELSEK